MVPVAVLNVTTFACGIFVSCFGARLNIRVCTAEDAARHHRQHPLQPLQRPTYDEKLGGEFRYAGHCGKPAFCWKLDGLVWRHPVPQSIIGEFCHEPSHHSTLSLHTRTVIHRYESRAQYCHSPSFLGADPGGD